jgi:hypothetical protein
MFNSAKCIGNSTLDGGKALIKLSNDKDLGKEVQLYLQTEKYIRIKSYAAGAEHPRYVLPAKHGKRTA